MQYIKCSFQLNGTITEIGSSHKRCIARPHGGSHNNGMMSRFNIELVAKTLAKAHITLAVVNELEAKLSPSPSAYLQ